jgi:hypothetical protein
VGVAVWCSEWADLLRSKREEARLGFGPNVNLG